MKTRIAFLLAILLLFATPFPARADIAPPFQPPGANLFPPDETTQVRMLAETVIIEVQPEAPAGSLGQARVTAAFTLRNLGAESETMGVLFPLSANDGFYNYPEVSGFSAQVNGKTAATRRTTHPMDEEALPWAEFDVTFPPGEDVLIEVAYTLEGTGEYPYISFAYLLHTGAGWQGSIGSAEIIVRMPYAANALNVFIDSSPGWGGTTPGALLDGQQIRWTFENLEPDFSSDISVVIVMPTAWNKFLTEQANVDKDPQDGEAWGRLGKIAKEISRLRRGSREDAGGLALFAISQQAYQQAVDLLPEDALWHAGYAELLFEHYYWIESWQNEKPGLLHALRELEIAWRLNPDEPFIVELMDDMRHALPDGLSLAEGGQATFHWLTATPTYAPTEIPIVTPTLATTETLEPVAAVTEAPAQETVAVAQALDTPTAAAAPGETTSPGGSSFPLCGGALLPFVLFVPFWLGRKKINHRDTEAQRFREK